MLTVRRDPIADLPEGLLAAIAAQLSQQDLQSASQVCSEWSRLLGGLVRVLQPSSLSQHLTGRMSAVQSLDLSRVGAQLSNSMFGAVAQLTTLQALDLTGCTRLTSLEPVAELSGLHTLNLSRCRGLGQGALSSIKSLGKLRSLDCTGCSKLSLSDVAATGHHPDLLQLSLAACPSMMLAAAELCSSCPRLAALNLNSNQELTDRQLQAILAAAVALKDLQANGCSYIRFRMVCTSATQLETLSVRDCAMVDDTGLSCIAITCPALRAVCLEDCPAISDAGIAALASSPHLSSLSCAGCSRVTGACLRPGSFAALTRLDLSRDPLLGHEGAEALAGLTRLRQLNLASNNMWDDACLAALTSLPALQDLSIAHCCELTSAAVPLLTSRAPHLTRLDLSMCSSVGLGLNAVSQLRHLACLDAAECQVTRAGVEAIMQLPHLKALNLAGCSLSAEDAARLSWVTSLNLIGCQALDTSEQLRASPLKFDHLAAAPTTSVY